VILPAELRIRLALLHHPLRAPIDDVKLYRTRAGAVGATPLNTMA